MRAFLPIIVSVILLLLYPGSLLADQTIVIDLNPPNEKISAVPKQNVAQNQLSKTFSPNTAISKPETSASSQKLVPIGRIGIITAPKARIQRYPSGTAQNLYICAKDTPLAIISEVSGWYGVLMVDSSIGWVEKKNIDLLDYQLMGTQSYASGHGDRLALGSSIVNRALMYLGVPYKWGGTTNRGMDCSAFVRSVFRAHGISLPRVARDQAKVGQEVKWDQLQPGDRLYFACKGGAVDHAGIYIGNGMFIHSSTNRGGVGIDKIVTPLFARSLVTARR